MNNLSFWIGRRYVFSKNNDGFVSFIASVSMLGLALGVAVLIIVLSVMNGFAKELQDRILGFVPHAIIYVEDVEQDWQKSATAIKQQSEYVTGVAPLNNLEAMLVSSVNANADFAILSGVSPKHEMEVSIIEDVMTEGSLQRLDEVRFGIILGELLAMKLGVSMGDKINVIVPDVDINITGVMPRTKRFTVVGIFSAKSEVDSRYGLVNIKDAALMKGLPYDSVESLRVKFSDIFSAPYFAHILAQDNQDLAFSRDWTRSYGNLFSSIQMEKRMVGLLLFLIIAVATFNILATLVILVKDKQANIAILRTMGSSSRQIVTIFILQGVFIGAIGSLVGVLIGLPVALYVNAVVGWIEAVFNVKFLSADTYFISYFPSQVIASDVIMIVSVSFFLCVFATIYPAIRAMKIDPAKVLKSE